MLTIRLTRVGKKKDGSFRVVVIDSKRKIQAGNYLEMVGSYDPRVDTCDLKADRIKHWLSYGATVSDTVHNLLVSNKIIEGKKINVLPKKVLAPTAPEASQDTASPADVPSEAPAPVETKEDGSSEASAKEDNSVVAEKAAE
ncbi:MAG TPA: 30S ribosomal protein S16 [Candidatus Paceibacterota bacterium]